MLSRYIVEIKDDLLYFVEWVSEGRGGRGGEGRGEVRRGEVRKR